MHFAREFDYLFSACLFLKRQSWDLCLSIFFFKGNDEIIAILYWREMTLLRSLLCAHFIKMLVTYNKVLFFCFRTIYHCPFCNLCRVGRGLGIDYFHCMTCNCCLGIKLVNHKCLEKSLETNCPICCDFLFTSSSTVRALPCGHYMHSSCFQVFIHFPSAFCLSACMHSVYQMTSI